MEETIREIIQRELPPLVMKDAQIRDWVWHLIHDYAPSKVETESRFDQMMAELRAMREESERKWEENQRKWEENQRLLQAMREESERKWEENQRKWEENQRRWEENQRQLQAMREESERKWEENQRRWEEYERRWQENQEIIQKLIERDEKIERRIETTIGAIGARWGASSEATFRNALKAILEESFGVKVERVEYFDEKGEVYGHPDQIEMDVIIRNGQVLVCEIKSSVSRSDVYTFGRKVRFYEKQVQRTVDRMLLISPMINKEDKELAQKFGMEVYSDAEKVAP